MFNIKLNFTLNANKNCIISSSLYILKMDSITETVKAKLGKLPKVINKVYFTALSPTQWMKYAVLEITEGTRGGNVAGSLYDERLGVIDNGKICLTCGKNNLTCPGHFGYIVLPIPIYNPKFLQAVQRILKCICFSCSKLRLTDEQIHLYNLLRIAGGKDTRLRAFVKRSENIPQCPHCHSPQPSYDFRNGISLTFDDSPKQPLPAKHAYQILARISDADFITLGFNHFPDITDETRIESLRVRPESFIFTILPVLPQCDRPPVIRDGKRYDDDLTDMYNNIIRIIGILREKTKRLTTLEKEKYEALLEEQVCTLIDNHTGKSKLSSGGRPHKSLTDRIIGKEGRIRENVGGKRSDYSSRAVITCGPHLQCGEVGIPQTVAETLSIPEYALEWNLKWCQWLVDSDKANVAIRDGQRIRLSIAKQRGRFIVRIGDIINRHLLDGDAVLFNRQPTIRTESIRGFRIRVMKGQMTFCFPLPEARAFNADYDGDEMNIHLPQSYEARAEIMACMQAARGINTSQRNGPVGGCEHDALAAMWMLTDGHCENEITLVDKKTAFDAIVHAHLEDKISEWLDRSVKYYPEYISKEKPHYITANEIPGKMLVSILFPSDFFFERTTNKLPERPTVFIHNGVLLPNSGPLDKDMLGSKRNNIIHYMWLEYGMHECERFITSVCKLSYLWLTHVGFSIGLRDCVLTDEGDIRKQLIASDAKCMEILSNPPSAEREVKLNLELNNLMAMGVKLASSGMARGRKNSFNIMKDSGAKGSGVNCAQITAFVGQQNIGGKRPPKMLSGRTRRLPYYLEDDDSPEAGGFVYGSYLGGLSVSESFYAAQGGRVGVIDTSVRTAESGYAQKRATKKMEDFVVRGDGSVRDSEGAIVQFQYGDDGMDAIGILNCPGAKFPLAIDVRREAKKFGGKDERELTDEEMTLILSQLRVGMHICELTEIHSEIVQEEYRSQLKQVKVSPVHIPQFARRIFDRHSKAMIATGTSVGLIAASSLGEPVTQQTLSTFHSSGIAAKDVTMGLPRLNELMNTTKNPSRPIVQIAFKSQETVDSLSKKRKIFESIPVSALVESSKLLYIEENVPGGCPSEFAIAEKYTPPIWYPLIGMIPAMHIEKNSWVIRLKFSLEKLYDLDLTLKDIATVIANEMGDGIAVLRSPLVFGEIEFYCDVAYLSSYSREKVVSTETHVSEENMTYYLVRNVALKGILDVQICGVKGILKTTIREDDGKDSPFNNPNREWVIDAGVTVSKGLVKENAFLGVLCQAVNPRTNIDAERTWTNDLWETLDVLGIEATRALLYSEFNKIISFDGTYVNPRHLQLLVDSMTRNGSLTSVRRDGITEETGILAQGLFEKAIENFASAAMFARSDSLKGLSGCVMYGATISAGTGSVHVKSCDDAI